MIEDVAYFREQGFEVKSIRLSEKGRIEYSLFLSDPSTFKTFHFLQNQPNIRSLTFRSVANLPHHEFEALSDISSIDELDFWDCQGMSKLILSHVLKNKNLKILNLGNCLYLTRDSLKGLSLSHQLKSLNLAGCKNLTDEALSSLVRLRNLILINLTFCSISDLGLSFLKEIRSLQDVSLNYCVNISNVGIQDISTISGIKSLSLNNCKNINANSLYILQQLDQLESLNIGGTELADHDLVGLPRQLRSLGLGWTENLTDEGIFHILNLTELENLVLNRCVNVTDKGITLLSKLKKLKTLDLRNCPMIANRLAKTVAGKPVS
jgi:F-box/leucine-rich repeat protein 14